MCIIYAIFYPIKDIYMSGQCYRQGHTTTNKIKQGIIDELHSQVLSESRDPKRSKLRISPSVYRSLYTSRLSMSHILTHPISHITHTILSHYSSNSHMTHSFPMWLSLSLFWSFWSIRYPFLSIRYPFFPLAPLTLPMTQVYHMTSSHDMVTWYVTWLIT